MNNSNIKPGDNQGLKRVLGRTDVLTLAFGTMVGWGWVMLSGVWIKEAELQGLYWPFQQVQPFASWWASPMPN